VVRGRRLLTLTCHDGWQLLHQLEARRQASFGVGLGVPTLTVDQIIRWMLAKAGIDYTVPASSTLRSLTPEYSVLPGHSLGTAMLDLLDGIEGFLLMTDAGATVIGLSASDTTVYTFGNVASQQPVLQIFHTQELQPANIVTVYTGASPGVLPEAIAAQAMDTANGRLLGATTHERADLQLPPANAAAVANAMLRKAQISTPAHSFISLPQVAQELGDVVTVVDPLGGTSYTGRVQSFQLQFNRDTGEWLQEFSLSPV
jgi:hypothetical protein